MLSILTDGMVLDMVFFYVMLDMVFFYVMLDMVFFMFSFFRSVLD